MTVTINKDTSLADQINRIRKFANISIVIIWVAGFSAFMVLATYFIIIKDRSKTENNNIETIIGSAKLSGEKLFTDKTTLVNIGLRIQAIPGDTDVVTRGTISINKIIHDQQLKRIKKPIKPDFSIGAVPK